MRSLLLFTFLSMFVVGSMAACVANVANESPQVVCPAPATLNTDANQCYATFNAPQLQYIRYPEVASGANQFGVQRATNTNENSAAGAVLGFSTTDAATACTLNNVTPFVLDTTVLGFDQRTDSEWVGPAFGVAPTNGFYCIRYPISTTGFTASTPMSGAACIADDQNTQIIVGTGSFSSFTTAFATEQTVNAFSTGSSVTQASFAWANTGAGISGGLFNVHSQGWVLNTPGYTDNCQSNPSITYSPSFASTFPAQIPQGVQSTTATVNDGTTTDNCVYSITVVDNQDPVLFCPVAYRRTNQAGACVSAPLNFYNDLTFSDNCPISLADVTSTIPNNSQFEIGDTAVGVTITDVDGNTDSCVLLVTVVYEDQCPPAQFVPLGTVSSPTVTYSDNTAGIAVDILCDTSCGTFSGQRVKVYSFHGPSGGIYGVDVALTSGFSGAGVTVFRCGVDRAQVCEQSFINTYPFTVETIPGALYYVVVGSVTGTSGAFTLSLTLNLCALPSFS